MCLWLFLKNVDAFVYLNRKRYKPADMKQFIRILTLFVSLYSHMLVVIDDDEFYNVQLPLHLDEVSQLVVVLKNFMFDLYARNPNTPTTDEIHLR